MPAAAPPVRAPTLPPAPRLAVASGEGGWSPNPGPQAAFLACGHRESLYGGAAGGGKSDALLASAIRHVDAPDHNAILFRRSYPELRNLIRRSLQVYPVLGGVYNRARHEWRFPSGASLIFRFIASEEDVYAYQGDAFTFIGWDELTQFPGDATDADTGETANSAYLFMLSRLRRGPSSRVRLMVRATCNPGGPGHHWVKSRFGITDAGDAALVRDPRTGLHRSFFPARIDDNPHLAGGEYARTLEGLPALRRRALREGRWDVFAGAQFAEWNPRLHLVDPYPIPGHWLRWRGADDGFVSPACCVWLAQDPDSRQLVAYQELHQSHLTAPALATRVLELDRRNPAPGAPPFPDESLAGILDNAAFASNGQSDVSRGDQMNRLGCAWREAMKGPGSRRLRVKRLHDLLAPIPGDPLQRPGLVCFRGFTPHLAQTLPALPRDPGDPEDVDTTADDHAFDALTYALQYRPSLLRQTSITGL